MEKTHKGISRIETERSQGWFVRAYKDNKIYSKFFSDRKYKTQVAGFKEALAHRNKIWKELGIDGKRVHHSKPFLHNKSNKTGMVGVCRTFKRTVGAAKRECYSATWNAKRGEPHVMSFYIDEHGEKKAFKLACEYRLKMLEETYGKEVVQKLLLRGKATSRKSK
jgi:hypothetical protein